MRTNMYPTPVVKHCPRSGYLVMYKAMFNPVHLNITWYNGFEGDRNV